MPVFAYSIAADQDRPSEGDGYVQAETIQQAVALVGHPEVNVYPLPADAVWPGDPVDWSGARCASPLWRFGFQS